MSANRVVRCRHGRDWLSCRKCDAAYWRQHEVGPAWGEWTLEDCLLWVELLERPRSPPGLMLKSLASDKRDAQIALQLAHWRAAHGRVAMLIRAIVEAEL
jgi:hypothetical protein